MSELHSPSKSPLHFEHAQEMIGSPELVTNHEGEGLSSRGACGSQHPEEGLDLLLLLLSVVQADRHPMPMGTFTARVVMEQVSHIAGNSPVMVDMMNDREAIIELELESVVVHAAQALQTTRVWDGWLAEITCIAALHHSVMLVIHKQEITQNRLQQLEAES